MGCVCSLSLAGVEAFQRGWGVSFQEHTSRVFSHSLPLWQSELTPALWGEHRAVHSALHQGPKLGQPERDVLDVRRRERETPK